MSDTRSNEIQPREEDGRAGGLSDALPVGLERIKTFITEVGDDEFDQISPDASDEENETGEYGKKNTKNSENGMENGKSWNRGVPRNRKEYRKARERMILDMAKELRKDQARRSMERSMPLRTTQPSQNPIYRDWETSDRSLRFLEERIARFNRRQMEAANQVEAAEERIMHKKSTPRLLGERLKRFEPKVTGHSCLYFTRIPSMFCIGWQAI